VFKKGKSMKQFIARAVNMSVLAAVAVVGTGCATSGSLEEMRGMIKEAASAAQSAQRSADQAQNTADAALQDADEAGATADAAAQAAQKAQMCCNANTERMDRMFLRAQQK
jgi:F0F1-type ATP synthase membrane subunit b/b'